MTHISVGEPGANLLSEIMLPYYQLDLYEQTSMKFLQIFPFTVIHYDMTSARWRQICLALIVFTGAL